MTAQLISSQELAERIKTQVVALVVGGVVPGNIDGFADLHDHVDANCLGGTEAMWDALPVDPDGEVNEAARDELCDLMNAAHESVNEWIKSTAFPTKGA